VSKVGVFVGPGRSIEKGIERARLVEALGYDSAWVIQVSDREATIVAAAFAGATERISIGTGVLPVYPRTPVVMAQTAATLDELSGGRFILGVGPSHKVTIQAWHGMELTKPLQTIREYVEAVGAILRGEQYFGEIYKTAFQFTGYEPVRRDLPIYISCLSPKMCELAGEVADGAILWMCAPSYIGKVVVPHIERGRKRAGKTMDGFEVVAAVPLSLTDNPAAGRDAFRQVTAVYWNLPFYRAAVAGAGFEEVLARFDAGGPPSIPDEVVDAFAGIGSKEDCRRAIDEYRSSGVTVPALSPLPIHEGYAGFEPMIEALSG
jgi:alkanesulfonate monooxygenase SsuD/methylene tetrahydromethanopterin reductase-like flavin-dependent oxidoreductase (luciferase family)